MRQPDDFLIRPDGIHNPSSCGSPPPQGGMQEDPDHLSWLSPTLKGVIHWFPAEKWRCKPPQSNETNRVTSSAKGQQPLLLFISPPGSLLFFCGLLKSLRRTGCLMITPWLSRLRPTTSRTSFKYFKLSKEQLGESLSVWTQDEPPPCPPQTADSASLTYFHC